jgi:hypothetical protein
MLEFNFPRFLNMWFNPLECPTIELPARNARAPLGVNAVVKKNPQFFHRLPSLGLIYGHG